MPLRFVMFYHSLVSDWNHGNAHFLRGVVAELQSRGHEVLVLEPRNGWSRSNLLESEGQTAVAAFHRAYPSLKSELYDADSLDLAAVLKGADVVIVHEWNDHDLVERIGRHRRRLGGFILLFHDTHHRSVTDRASMANYDLRQYDGVLAYGGVIRDIYIREKWTNHAWTWHEAADTRLFHPRRRRPVVGDVVWVGNWGDEERTAELREFLMEPVSDLGLDTCIYGVRYPPEAREELAARGIRYKGWLANHRVPATFASYRMTVHIPRRPYTESLPGIPTIRPFEALACGIPLISSPWQDTEGLFREGVDYLVARNGDEMCARMEEVLSNRDLARELAKSGRQRILERHTCAHRVDELMSIISQLDQETGSAVAM